MVSVFTYVEDALRNLFGALSTSIVRLALAVIIFLFGFVIGKLLGRVIYKVLSEIELNKFLKDSMNIKVNADHLVSNFVTYIIYFLAVISALEEIGIANIILYILSIVVILIILISFFLAMRDFLPNFISGLYLYSRDNLKPGNHIEINEISGELLHIDLLHMKIKTKNGDIIYLPNNVVANSQLKVKKK